jgi:PhnB protein
MAKTTRRAAAKRKAVRKRKAAPVPKGYRTVTPHLVLDDCVRGLDFYKKAMGAREKLRMAGPDGKIAHAEIWVGDSIVMLSDEMPPMPGQPGVFKGPKNAGLATGALFLYVKDCDGAFDRAIQAGCTVRTPVMDMFWGDRFGQVIDPFGHTWAFATHLEDLTPKQMAKRQEEFMARMAQGENA